MRELEFKCVVDEDFEVLAHRVKIPGALMLDRFTAPIHDEYFDTDDLRLARWGVTVRWRDGEGWTVKLPRRGGTNESVLDRDEVRFEGDRATMPEEVRGLVASLVRNGDLVEVARIDTNRTTWVWQRSDGSVAGELVDDHVIGSAGKGEVCFREIEFELGAGSNPNAMPEIIKSLKIERRLPAIPKLVRVLGDAASEPADVMTPVVPDDPSAADVIHAAIAASVEQLLTQVPAARLGVDLAGVHQARVATRRLRSDLRTFAPLLDKDWAKQLRRELGWLADELGAVRDGDVLHGHLVAAIEANPEIGADGGAEILGCLARERNQRRETLLFHLADRRAITLFDHLVDAAANPRIRKRAFRRSASALLPALVQTTWRALRSGVDQLDSPPHEVELHAVRILAKRVRYAAEAVSPAVGRDARKFAKGAAVIQDSLGDLHDSVVAAQWLEHAATTELSGSAGFAAGRLAQQLRTRAALDASSWRSSYDKMCRRARWLGNDEDN